MLQFPVGVKSISVEGNTYYADDLKDQNTLVNVEITPRISNVTVNYDPMEKQIEANYGTVNWTAEAEDGFTVQSSGSVTAKGTIVNIIPTSTKNS